MASLEQRPRDESLQRLDAPAESGGGESELFGGGLDRSKPSNLHERLDGG
jgi:hypothetical protein